jgi:hypothetical protein
VSLAALEMSVPAGDGLILKGTLTYAARYAGASFPELLRFLQRALVAE